MKVLLATIALLLIALGSGFVTIDDTSSAHGISIGTDTHYCSIEFGHMPTCETAQ